jgi:putative NADH-flavin reductase
MPSYALLGATGSTGSNILSVLLRRPDTEVHALVRSRAKLEFQLNHEAPPNLKVYEGSLSNLDLLAKCITGVQAVFITLGPVGNQPGCTIVQDAVASLIVTMRNSQEKSLDTQPPRVVLLSSASLQTELYQDMPHFVHSMLMKAAHYVYADVAAGERMLRAESRWIKSTFVKPGGLVHDEPRGHILTTDRQQTFTSFADLAAGMVEVAEEEDGRWDHKFVGVVPKSKARLAWGTPLELFKGLVTYYFPDTYGWLH